MNITPDNSNEKHESSDSPVVEALTSYFRLAGFFGQGIREEVLQAQQQYNDLRELSEEFNHASK